MVARFDEVRWHGIMFQDALVRALLRAEEPKDVTRRTSERWAGVQAGDRLWVRECFALPRRCDGQSPTAVGESCVDAGYSSPWAPIWYRSDKSYNGAVPLASAESEEWRGRGKWRPSVHLPRWGARIFLEVVSVREEPGRGQWPSKAAPVALPMIDDVEARREGVESRAAFLDLWRSINGDAFPERLYRIEFRRLERASSHAAALHLPPPTGDSAAARLARLSAPTPPDPPRRVRGPRS